MKTPLFETNFALQLKGWRENMENFCGSKPPEGGCGSRQAQGFYPLWQPTASVFHGNRRFADCDPIAQFDRFDPRTTIGLPLEIEKDIKAEQERSGGRRCFENTTCSLSGRHLEEANAREAWDLPIAHPVPPQPTQTIRGRSDRPPGGRRVGIPATGDSDLADGRGTFSSCSSPHERTYQ
ncbi:hypothetical protein KUF71_000580 [Frankliniella fusca]|uniref:Uncharacterized protein n=1 Tax=Frankliniella fusca TaxID=407009 RepID=A0AAE1GT14_9NEOP|nr:hypothetical protein KUF71_000580 [Frankliniella fusca]